ncbi:MAG: BACON domain-containing protein [Rikenellaceae bacterium]|nr:BACON domain-containing protein [Rikenellaceae bacterium]
MKNIINGIAFCTALLFFSCTRGKGIETVIPDTKSETVAMDFQIQLPKPASSGINTVEGTDQENYIKDITVLAFKVDDSGPANVKEYFLYKAQGHSIENMSTSSHKKFTVTIFKKDFDQKFVLLANAADATAHISKADSMTLKNDLLEDIIFENNNVWHAASQNQFTPLPMWGESAPERIDDSTTQVGTVKLLRSIARVDVWLSTDEAKEDFVLDEIYIYNHLNEGKVAPYPDDNIWDTDNYIVKNVSLPSTYQKIRDPFNIKAANDGTVNYIPTSYIFEAPEVDITNSSDATCIVIGGKYKDDATTSYYRVDFFKRNSDDDMEAYMQILRNHIYRINIMSVKGSGYTDPDEAFEAKSQNMDVEVIYWNEGDITDVVFDNQYMLGVSQGEYYVPKKQAEYSIIVTTDYPGGWKENFDETTYHWLHFVSGQFGGENSKDTVIFSVDENFGDTERVGYFTFTAGRLVYKVKVTQGIGDALTLQVVDNDGKPISELIFLCGLGNATVSPQSYDVMWTPDDLPLMVSKVSVSDVDFTHDNGYDIPETHHQSTGGIISHSIKPPLMTDAEVHPDNGNPFLEKTIRYNYMVTDNGAIEAKTILLRQIHYDVIAVPEEKYELDGSTYTLYVRSNANWTATLINDKDKVVKTPSSWSGGINTGEGTPIQFTVIETNDINSATATIRFDYQGEHGVQETKDVVLNFFSEPDVIIVPTTNYANTYMLKPGGDGITFPVGQANKDGIVTRIGATDEIELQLLWTDVAEYLGTDAAIRSFALEGQGSSASITVIPGSVPGNAVIAAVVNGTIRWSWHIWVVDYDGSETVSNTVSGYKYEFMTYNLGATDGTNGSDGSLGLVYQWGRKDPFPGIASISGTSARTIYNAKNTVTTSLP